MKDFKVKALSVNRVDWVTGLLSISQGKGSQPAKGYYICNSVGMPWAYQVRPETVGLYTGINDNKNVEIYVGDTIKVCP